MEKAGKILKEYLEKVKKYENPQKTEIFGKWTEIIGKNSAEHVQIKELEKKTLFLEVDHPGWYQKVKFKEKEILKKIKSLYRELDIQTIRTVLIMRPRVKKAAKPEKKENSEEYKNFLKVLNRFKENLRDFDRS